MAKIILSTFNARYTHASLGLRAVLANMGNLQSQTQMVEFDLEKRPEEALETLLSHNPNIIGFGVYIWNTELITRTVWLLKQLRPDIQLILGGAEASHALDDHPLFTLTDYLISGEGEEIFPTLCQNILAGHPPQQKKLIAPPANLHHLQLPYTLYNSQDLAHRQLYVEASRGCPYRCAFCLSALDLHVRNFDLEPFLAAMKNLFDRGGRRYKFVDRTFNLGDAQAIAILDFFLTRAQPGLFLHFEMVPDRLSPAIKARLAAFPPGVLQLEIGIQSFNPTVLKTIHRQQENKLAETHLRWLLTHTHAHLHTDLIVGLPGESLESFATGFDRLIAIAPHEIQVGILKRLAGTPLTTLTQEYPMLFNTDPPYELLTTQQIDFFTMRRLKRFARYWDLVGNSGRFKQTLAYLFSTHPPFAIFMQFSDWLFATTHQTHNIALPRLARLVEEGLTAITAVNHQTPIAQAINSDLKRASQGSKSKSNSPPPRQARDLITKESYQ